MILVTGANGMVGSYVRQVFGEAELFLTDRNIVDVTDYSKVLQTFERVRPTVVLHLAAATDVDRCQTDVDWAFRVNVLGTQNIVLGCQRWNTLLVHVSTSSVFNGQKEEPYTEFDEPGPINVYGKTKWEAEKIVQNFLHRYFIVRASWMIGGGREKDKKFVAKIIHLCETKKTLDVVDDKFGTITYAKDFLEVIRFLLDTPFYGVYHAASRGVCTRYDIACEIAKCLGSPVTVRPVASSHFPLPAPRAESEALASYKLTLMGKNTLPDWRQTLKEYLNEYHSLPSC